MKILGIRTAPTVVRYAILDWNGNNTVFVNANAENKLDFPAGISNSAAKLHWLYQELERILRQNPTIERIAIKINEYGRVDSITTRDAAYLDAIVLLIAEEKTIPIEMLMYKSIGTNRNKVKSYSQSICGLSTNYWNEQIADAIAVASAVRN